MSEEARHSYLRALDLAGDDPRDLQRALLGLARLGSPVDGDGPDGLGPRMKRLREQDPQAADFVEGNAALKSGDYARALYRCPPVPYRLSGRRARGLRADGIGRCARRRCPARWIRAGPGR